MSDSILNKVIPKLGLLCFEYHAEGYFSCVGESPNWAMELFPCIRNRFPRILPCDISPFLENFIVDAEEFWQQNNGSILRSGYWTESVQSTPKTPQIQTSEIHLEALVLTIDGRSLLLLEVSEVKFSESFHWLQTARTERLDSIVERKETASQMMSATLFDALTGLPNEQAFHIQISQCLERLRRNPTQHFLLLKLTIDHFQAIDATLSQEWGNQCLMLLAKRLKGYGEDQDVVARLGPDTFGLLIHHRDAIAHDEFVQQLIASLRSPYQWKSQQIYTTNSIGVVKIEDARQTVEQLMGNVALALKQARANGRDQYCTYDLALRDRQMADFKQEQDFLKAFHHHSLVAEYRPLFSRQANQFVGLEAILEWPLAAYSPEELRTVAKAQGLEAQIATQEIESCFPVLSHFSANLPITLLIHASPAALWDRGYQQALLSLTERMKQNDTVILKFNRGSTSVSIDELAPSLQILTDLNIKLCVSLSDLEGVSQVPAWLQVLDFLSVDPGRHNLTMGSIKMVHPELKSWKTDQPKLLAEQVNSHHHDPMIADLGIDLCCGDFFSEPLPLQALKTLLQSQSGA